MALIEAVTVPFFLEDVATIVIVSALTLIAEKVPDDVDLKFSGISNPVYAPPPPPLDLGVTLN